MSDGRSFAQEEVEKTLEERITTLEQKIPSYQARIAAYDALFDGMHALVLKVEMEKEKTDGYKNAIDNLGESVAKLHNSQVERINKLQTDLITHKDETSSIVSSQDDLQDSMAKMVGQLSDKLDAHKKYHESALDSKASSAEVAALQVTTNKSSELQSKFMLDLKKSVDNVVHGIEAKIQELKDNGATRSALASEIESIVSKVTALKAEVANSKDSIPSMIVQLESKIAKSCDALRQEIVSKPSELTDLKNEIAKKLEAVTLDANSANIRSQNSDKKVFLLEKQLENAQLLIKKLELK